MKSKKFKKILSVAMVLTMLFGTGITSVGNTINSFSIKASAVDTTTVVQDGISYEYHIGEDGLVIDSATGTFSKNYTIPEKINGINVMCIGIRCFKGNKTIEEVTIPEGIRFLGNGSFSDCTNLRTVYFNAGQCSTKDFTYAGTYSFFDGTALATIVFGTNVKVIPDYLCRNAALLENVEFKGNVSSIGEESFYKCTSLKGIDAKFLNHLTEIGDYAFFDSDFETFIAPSMLTKIGDWAFSKTPIKTLDLGRVQQIGTEAFSECQYLESVTIPNTTTKIGRKAFYNCQSLEKVWFNANETENNNLIAWSAVDGNYSNVFTNSGVTEIIFGANVTRIPKKVFDAYLPNESAVLRVETVRFNAKITEIGLPAFKDCNYLTDIYFPGTKDEWKKVKNIDANDVIDNATIHYNYNPNQVVIDNNDLDVSISFEKGTFDVADESELTLNVVPIENDSDEFSTFKANIIDGEQYALYKISVGNNIQPTQGKLVTIKVKCPEGITSADKVFIFHKKADGGTERIKSVKLEDGYLIFDTSSFSEFAVCKEKTSVKLDNLSLNYKKTGTLNPEITGEYKSVKYESSDTKVAIVDDNGNVTAVNRGSGTTTITCTVVDADDNIVTAECTVSVSLTFWQKIIVYVLFGWIWY